MSLLHITQMVYLPTMVLCL